MIVTANGTRSSAGGFASAQDNYAFYNFEVSGGAVDYSLSYTKENNGVLKLTGGPNNTNITLVTDQDMLGTLEPGVYNINAFHSQSVITTTELPARSENSGFTFAMTFEEGTNLSPVPIPAAAWLFGSALFGITALARRRREVHASHV